MKIEIGNACSAAAPSNESNVALPDENIRNVIHSNAHIIPPNFRPGWSDLDKLLLTDAFDSDRVKIVSFNQDKFTGKPFAVLQIDGKLFNLFGA